MDYVWSVCAHQTAFYDGHDITPIKKFVKEFSGEDKDGKILCDKDGERLCWLSYDSYTKHWLLWQKNRYRCDHAYSLTIFENNYVINEGPYEGIVVIGENALNARYFKENPLKQRKLTNEDELADIS